MNPWRISTVGAKVVARYADGRIVRGYTFDFQVIRPHFHVFADRSTSGGATIVQARELKAAFFVRDLAGDPAYVESKDFGPGEERGDRRVELVFADGERLVGWTHDSVTGAYYFPIVPVDDGANNLAAYAVPAATQLIRYLEGPSTSIAALARAGRDFGRRPRPAGDALVLPARVVAAHGLFAWLWAR